MNHLSSAGGSEPHGRVMDPSQPSADLYQSRVRVRPSGPGNTVADHLAGQVSEHLAPLLIEAECSGNAVNPGILQVPQQGVYRRRPRSGPLVDDAADPHRPSVRPPARVSSLIAVVYLTSSNSDSDFVSRATSTTASRVRVKHHPTTIRKASAEPHR